MGQSVWNPLLNYSVTEETTQLEIMHMKTQFLVVFWYLAWLSVCLI